MWCKSSDVICPDEQAVVQYKTWLLGQYKLTTAQSYFAVIKLFFAWLAKNGSYEDVASGIRGVSVNRTIPLKDYLSGSNMMKVLSLLWKRGELSKSILDLRDYVIVLLMVCCGLRVTEVTRLDVGDIILTSEGHHILIHGKGRDGKSDLVNVPDCVVSIVQKWLFLRSNFTKKSSLFISLSTRNFGGRLCSRTVSQVVKKALLIAGFDSPRLTAHSLRHTAITLALMAGANLQETQQFARHRRLETTQIYAHNLEIKKNRYSKLVAGIVMGTMKKTGKVRLHIGDCKNNREKIILNSVVL